jgi:hypothetical protein
MAATDGNTSAQSRRWEDVARLTTADVARAAERAQDPTFDQPMRDREVALTAGGTQAADVAEERAEPLLSNTVTQDLRARWQTIQTGFVDEPRRAVEEADALVAEAIKHLAESFAATRANLEREWDKGEDVSTEDLRQVLRRYRSFFSHLLEI